MAAKGGLGRGIKSGGGLDSVISRPVKKSEGASPKQTAAKKPQEKNAVKNSVRSVNTKEKKQSDPPENTVVQLSVTEVEPSREQPRKYFGEEGLQELADSIRQHGVITPILVQKKEDYYEIIAGERRWRAAKLAKLKEIPAIIRTLDPRESVEIALIENIQREDLNPIEEAQAYRRLLEEFHLSQEETAQRVSKSRTAVTNSLRLLRLDEKVQQMLIDGQLTQGHARVLIPVEDPAYQVELASRIIAEKLSVRQVEKLIKQWNRPQKAPAAKKQEDLQVEAAVRHMETRLTDALGSRVVIQNRKNKGKIQIEYYSNEELEAITEYLMAYKRNTYNM